jgi:hypothetical protein
MSLVQARCPQCGTDNKFSRPSTSENSKTSIQVRLTCRSCKESFRCEVPPLAKQFVPPPAPAVNRQRSALDVDLRDVSPTGFKYSGSFWDPMGDHSGLPDLTWVWPVVGLASVLFLFGGIGTVIVWSGVSLQDLAASPFFEGTKPKTQDNIQQPSSHASSPNGDVQYLTTTDGGRLDAPSSNSSGMVVVVGQKYDVDPNTGKLVESAEVSEDEKQAQIAMEQKRKEEERERIRQEEANRIAAQIAARYGGASPNGSAYGSSNTSAGGPSNSESDPAVSPPLGNTSPGYGPGRRPTLGPGSGPSNVPDSPS